MSKKHKNAQANQKSEATESNVNTTNASDNKTGGKKSKNSDKKDKYTKTENIPEKEVDKKDEEQELAKQDTDQESDDTADQDEEQESNKQPKKKTTAESKSSPLAEVPVLENPMGCFIRALWMIVGKVVLVILFLILVRTGKTYNVIDYVYLAVVLGLIYLRYIDIRYFQGKTGTGEKATLKDWATYSALLIGVSGLLWFGAHAIAKYILR